MGSVTNLLPSSKLCYNFFVMDKQPSNTVDETTKSEILEAINSFASDVQKEFTILKTDISEIKTDVATLKTDVAVLKTDVATLKGDVTRMESQMVTKSYLDEKLGALKGDTVALIRKEDTKTDRIVEELELHNVLPPASIQTIRDLHVFPAQPAV